MALPYVDKDNNYFEKTYHRLFDLFLDLEWKIDCAIHAKPKFPYEYIHSRYSPKMTEIIDEEWGHAQHDAIGAFLFGVGLGINHDKKMLRNRHDERILQKLVYYLESIQYWQDPDNGIWEEQSEIHLSSVGACISGLKAVSSVVKVPDQLILNGMRTATDLFPCESSDKRVDLALLSLVYPYDLFGPMGDLIITNVEKHLLRDRGVIRYEGDSYYSLLENNHGRNLQKHHYFGTEAEWSFGLPWLALCHLQMGRYEKAREYIKRTEQIMLEGSLLPELFMANTNKPNPNSPLGWSQAMYILAKEAILRFH